MARNSRGRGRLPPRSITTRGSTPAIQEEVIQSLQRETGQSAEAMDIFVDTYTSKKTNSFFDEQSRVAAVWMKEVASQHMDESGSCNLSGREIVEQVLGPGKKGRDRMMGIKTAGKKKGTQTITVEDVERVVEAVRRENSERMETLRRENEERMEALRLETVANMQAAIQAMIASGQLMVPPTGPRQDSGARQDEVDEEDNTRGRQ